MLYQRSWWTSCVYLIRVNAFKTTRNMKGLRLSDGRMLFENRGIMNSQYYTRTPQIDHSLTYLHTHIHTNTLPFILFSHLPSKAERLLWNHFLSHKNSRSKKKTDFFPIFPFTLYFTFSFIQIIFQYTFFFKLNNFFSKKIFWGKKLFNESKKII